MFNMPLLWDPLFRLYFCVLWQLNSCANQIYIYYAISLLRHYLYVFRDLSTVFRGLCHRVLKRSEREFDSSYDFVPRFKIARILGPHSRCKFPFLSFQQQGRVYSDIPTA